MNYCTQLSSVTKIIETLNRKEVIAYPTEAFFGIGCYPDSEIAVNRLLKLKKRSIKKGLILVASSFEQLKPYVNDSILTSEQKKILFSAWPGPTTFLFPITESTPRWLTGCFNSIAVRITNFPLIIELCSAINKPLVSTSANLSGLTPCRTIQEIQRQFGNTLPIVEGKTGERLHPSEIRDVLTGKYIRKG